MAVVVLNTLGLKCPQPVLKIAVERDVRVWCERLEKILLSVREEGVYQKRIQIQF